MAAPTYSTDLTTINVVDTAGGTTNWTALGGGSSGLASETDYFIQGDGCISKAGFTGATKGMIYNGGTVTIAAGDAIFMWQKQNNRNLMDTVANGGQQILVGSSTSDFDQFYIDGNNAAGSDLAGWRNYAVDPTQTPNATTGTPTNTNYIGGQWKVLGSGSLKGNPNAIDAFRHGREIRSVDGDGTSGYATFDGAATWDANTTRRWGILTPVAGGYQFHGNFVMGQSGTAVDFRDANRNIVVLDDEFLPAGFNEFEIINASSNVEWTNIQISHLGTFSPAVLTLNVGTFNGVGCRFDGFSTTTFNADGSSSCTDSTWANSGRVNLNEANIAGSRIVNPTVATDDGAVFDNRSVSITITMTEYDGCTIEKGTNAHHAIKFGTGVGRSFFLENMEFTGFNGTDGQNDSTFLFDRTSGSLVVTLNNCTVDGSAATESNVGIKTAGATVGVAIGGSTTQLTVRDTDGNPISGARVLMETSSNPGGGYPYQAAITSITQAAGVATVTTTAAHNLPTGGNIVIRGAQPDGYNKVATYTVTGASTFTYPVDSGLSSPATGTPVVSYVPISGTTNASGIILAKIAWPVSQSLSGWARKSTSSPYYKQSTISVADASADVNATVTLISDE